MGKFPVDAPIDEVIKAFESLGFCLVREGNHIAMIRESGRNSNAFDNTQPSKDKMVNTPHYSHTSWHTKGQVSTNVPR